MNQRPDHEFPELQAREELAFFGAITASATHELNNVLAMVNEFSGLIEDNLAGVSSGASVDAERIGGITKRIGCQVDRGKTILSSLNRFAHSVETSDAGLDLGETIETICGLCQRFAGLQRTQLIPLPAGGAVRMKGSAFVLQHLIYRCLEICIATANANTSVEIGCDEQGEEVLVRFTSQPDDSGQERSAPMMATLERLVGSWAGSVEVHKEVDHPQVLTLHLPHTITSPLR